MALHLRPSLLFQVIDLQFLIQVRSPFGRNTYTFYFGIKTNTGTFENLPPFHHFLSETIKIPFLRNAWVDSASQKNIVTDLKYSNRSIPGGGDFFFFSPCELDVKMGVLIDGEHCGTNRFSILDKVFDQNLILLW
jgi:hypothetical protein